MTAQLPGVTLSFSPSQTATVATQGRALDHIGFEVDDLAAFKKDIEELQVVNPAMTPKPTGVGAEGAARLALWGKPQPLVESRRAEPWPIPRLADYEQRWRARTARHRAASGRCRGGGGA